MSIHTAIFWMEVVMSIIGTNYFVSKNAAIRYWSHWEDAEDIVEHKLSIGELFIGEPPLKPGERLVVIDSGRYAIVTEE